METGSRPTTHERNAAQSAQPEGKHEKAVRLRDGLHVDREYVRIQKVDSGEIQPNLIVGKEDPTAVKPRQIADGIDRDTVNDRYPHFMV